MISITKLLPNSKILYKRVSANIVWVRIHSQSNNFNLINKNQNHKLNEMYQEKKVAFVNAKLSRGQGKPGTELGPHLLKSKFLFTNLENLNHPAFEHTEIDDAEVSAEDETPFLLTRNVTSISKTNQLLSAAVTKAIDEGHIPVVLGGDHSLAIGSVHGTANSHSIKSQIGLIWVDAHADINTPLTSTSGNLHGQPVSFLLYELDKYLPRLKAFDWIRPCISARNLVYIGLRDLDPEETILLKKYKIKAFSMSDIQSIGIQQVMKETLEHLTINGELLPLHVSVDIDSLDPWYAPCTGTPVLGGLTLSELMYIGNKINETGKLKTLDLVEVNPLLKTCESDIEKTLFSASRAILSFFGYKTLGTCNPEQQVPKPKPSS